MTDHYPRERSGAEVRACEILDPDREEVGEGGSRLAEFRRVRNDLEEHHGGRINDVRKIAYLAAFAITGKVKLSARIAGVSYYTIRMWRGDAGDNIPQDAELFCRLEEQSEELYQELLLEEVDRRALEGVEEDVYFQGKVVGSKRVYSDNLLMFRVKGIMPEYRSGATNVNINSDESGEINVNFTLPDMNSEIKNREIIDVGGGGDAEGIKEDQGAE